VHIVVLVKPVPDPASGGSVWAGRRLERASVPAVVNGNDEYALEAALKLTAAAGEASEVTLLSMASTAAPETLRKALAMGADSRGARHGSRSRRIVRDVDRDGPRRSPENARV